MPLRVLSPARLTYELRESGIDVPLRNDHDIHDESDGKMVSRILHTLTVDMAPTGENADRYSALSVSWGHKALYGGPVRVDREADELTGGLTARQLEWKWCQLCKKLDANYMERGEDRLRLHMRMK